jgi:tRNA A37 methylthiotransferase MiaB
MPVQCFFADLTHTGTGINAATFPLGIGSIAAFTQRAFGDEIVCSVYKFQSDLDTAFKQGFPEILALSNYAWNSTLAYEVAKFAKTKSPETVIVMGGPNFPLDKDNRYKFLNSRPEIDFYIKWDGEQSFVELLKILIPVQFDVDRLKKEMLQSENCCYIAGDDYVEGPDRRFVDMPSLLSPYVEGWFDYLFDYPLTPLIETTRGCPYSCTFCNDGPAIRSKIFSKPAEMIAEEFEYIGQRIKHSNQLIIADLNYGMYKEDLRSAAIIRDTYEKYRWPERIDASLGKSHPERILAVGKVINQGNTGIFRYGASFQSTDSNILKSIKRKNLPLQKFSGLSDLRFQASHSNSEFFTELILGLPDDNVARHEQSLRDVVDDLEMNNIDVHQLTVLQGTEMALPEERKKYEFDVRYRVFPGCIGRYKFGSELIPCLEIEELVVGNKTLTLDEYLKCRILDFLVKLYIDRDPFFEVFGVVKWLNLSAIDLLTHLRDHELARYPNFKAVIDSFVEYSRAVLFGSPEELTEFFQNHVDEYISGDYGFNEMLAHIAMAVSIAREETHEILQDSAIHYLRKEGVLTTNLEDYIEQAIDFASKRKLDVTDVESVKTGSYDYDFVEGRKFGYKKDPAELKASSTRFKFFHSNTSIDFINKAIGHWGNESYPKLGKLLQKNNLFLLDREVTRLS